LAAPLDEAELLAAFADQLTVETRLEEAAGKLRAKRLTRLGRIVVREALDDAPDPSLIAAALAGQVRDSGLGVLPWSPATDALRLRLGFLRARDPATWPDLSDAALLARLEDWLTPLLFGRRSLAAIPPGDLDGAVRALIPWERQQRLD